MAEHQERERTRPKRQRLIPLLAVVLLVGVMALLWFTQREGSFYEVMAEVVAEILPDEDGFEIYSMPVSQWGLGTIYRLESNAYEKGVKKYLWSEPSDWWAPGLSTSEQLEEWRKMIASDPVAVTEVERVVRRKIDAGSVLSLRNLLSKLSGRHEGTDGSVVRMKIGGARHRQLKLRALSQALQERKLAEDVSARLATDRYAIIYSDLIFETFEAEIEVDSQTLAKVEGKLGSSDLGLQGGSLKAEVSRQAEGRLRLVATEPVVAAVKLGRLPTAGLFSDDADWEIVAGASILDAALGSLVDDLDSVDPDSVAPGDLD